VRWNNILASEKDIRVELDKPAVIPATLGDASRLEQVFDNLLRNAIKFSSSGSSVTVRLFVEDEWVVVSVRDEGVGMEQDQLDTVLSGGIAASRLGTAFEAGFGLGFQIILSVISKHGGKVSGESSPGMGSKFYVWLPIPLQGKEKWSTGR
jgi:signal transduction histidine kinase